MFFDLTTAERGAMEKRIDEALGLFKNEKTKKQDSEFKESRDA